MGTLCVLAVAYSHTLGVVPGHHRPPHPDNLPEARGERDRHRSHGLRGARLLVWGGVEEETGCSS